MKYMFFIFVFVVFSLPANSSDLNGAKSTIDLINAYKKFGADEIKSFGDVCLRGRAYATGYFQAYNNGAETELGCYNKKILGYLTIGTNKYYFNTGALYKVKVSFYWGVEMEVFLYNKVSALIAFSDGINRVKISISDLNSDKFSIEEVILPSYERLSTYSKYYYPEIMIERYYREKRSSSRFQDFTGDLFNSRLTKSNIIEWLITKDSNN